MSAALRRLVVTPSNDGSEVEVRMFITDSFDKKGTIGRCGVLLELGPFQFPSGIRDRRSGAVSSHIPRAMPPPPPRGQSDDESRPN